MLTTIVNLKPISPFWAFLTSISGRQSTSFLKISSHFLLFFFSKRDVSKKYPIVSFAQSYSCHKKAHFLSAAKLTPFVRIWLHNGKGRKRNCARAAWITEINWVVITCASRACKYFRMRRCFAFIKIFRSAACRILYVFFLTARSSVRSSLEKSHNEKQV